MPSCPGHPPSCRRWPSAVGPAIAIVLSAVFVGCTTHTPGAESTAAEAQAPSAPPPATDAWLGRWTGPEGTALELAGGAGRYTVTVRNLDGPRSFTGHAAGAAIVFERDGVSESLQASDGDGTGMKWLAGKSDCLVVRPGEGYCRD